MDNKKDIFILEQLESLGRDKVITYSIYAYMPCMIKDREHKSVLTHRKKIVLTTTNIEIARDIFKEFNQFNPSIQATIIFD